MSEVARRGSQLRKEVLAKRPGKARGCVQVTALGAFGSLKRNQPEGWQRFWQRCLWVSGPATWGAECVVPGAGECYV